MKQTAKYGIFVVDDERVIATTIAVILNQNGYDARPFFSGEAALDGFPLEAPHVLISDLVMTGMSGVDLAVHARTLNAEVRYKAHDLDHRAWVIAKVFALGPDPTLLAVHAMDACLEFSVGTFLKRFPVLRVHTLPVFGVYVVQEGGIGPGGVKFCVAENLVVT